MIPIVGHAITILAPYLFGDGGDLCFTTSKGTLWNKDSYRWQITLAAKIAGANHWTPYQLRKTAPQDVRDQFGVEHVQTLLGHSRLDTSEVNVDVSRSKAIEAARVVSVLG